MQRVVGAALVEVEAGRVAVGGQQLLPGAEDQAAAVVEAADQVGVGVLGAARDQAQRAVGAALVHVDRRVGVGRHQLVVRHEPGDRAGAVEAGEGRAREGVRREQHLGAAGGGDAVAVEQQVAVGGVERLRRGEREAGAVSAQGVAVRERVHRHGRAGRQQRQRAVAAAVVQVADGVAVDIGKHRLVGAEHHVVAGRRALHEGRVERADAEADLPQRAVPVALVDVDPAVGVGRHVAVRRRVPGATAVGAHAAERGRGPGGARADQLQRAVGVAGVEVGGAVAVGGHERLGRGEDRARAVGRHAGQERVRRRLAGRDQAHGALRRGGRGGRRSHGHEAERDQGQSDARHLYDFSHRKLTSGDRGGIGTLGACSPS